MMTLLHLDMDVIITFAIIILRKIKEQVMPRLMWSLSASSLVVRRQLATRPHDHLQLYIFFPIVHTTIFNPISFATHSLLTRSLQEKKIILLTCKISLNLRPIFNSTSSFQLQHSITPLPFYKTIVFLDPTMFNTFHLSPHLNP